MIHLDPIAILQSALDATIVTASNILNVKIASNASARNVMQNVPTANHVSNAYHALNTQMILNAISANLAKSANLVHPALLVLNKIET